MASNWPVDYSVPDQPIEKEKKQVIFNNELLFDALDWDDLDQNPRWILDGRAWLRDGITGQCPQPQQISSQEDISQIETLDAYTRVPFHEDSPEMTRTAIVTTVEKLFKTYFELLRRRNGPQFELEGYGSYYLDNKTGKFDELDYQAVLSSKGLNIAKTNDPNKFKISMNLEKQHWMETNLKVYLFEGLKHYLRKIKRPDNPSTGQVYIQSMYTYQSAPGMCTVFAWHCENGHKHILSVDLTPCINWEDQPIKKQFCLPKAFNHPPFNSVRAKLESTPVHLVLAKKAPHEIEGDKISALYDITFGHVSSVIFECLDAFSPNVRVVYRVSKYVRDNLYLHLLNHSFLTDDLEGSWRDSSLVSSWVLFNILLQVVLLHPKAGDWDVTELPARLSSIVRLMLNRSYIDFYKGEPCKVMDQLLTTKHKELLFEMLEHDTNEILKAIAGEAWDSLSISDEDMVEEHVCVLCFPEEFSEGDRTSGDSHEVKLSLLLQQVPEWIMRYKTDDLRKKIKYGRRHPLFYYKCPKAVKELEGINIYHACMAVANVKFHNSRKIHVD